VADLVSELMTLRGRRVLVTGSTGFKGGWLCNWLVGLGAEVAGFALPPEPDAPLFRQLRLEERIRQIYGDIRDAGALEAAIAAFRPEAIIHLAAQAIVLRGYELPRLTFETNVCGGMNLLEAVRTTASVRALVFITSDKCYRNKEWIWAYRENDELGGSDPYSSSKAAIEVIFASYQDSYFRRRSDFAAASARAGNVIGGGDRSRDRIVPDCINGVETGRPITLRNPSATRPWQHVLEPVSGYLLLACRLLRGDENARGPWNFAPDVENVRTVREMAERVTKAWGAGEVVVAPESCGRHEAQLLMLSNEKAKTLLGWRPRWDFAKAVDTTVAWYRAVGRGVDPVQVTDHQIADYLGKAA
jgi:CDP-glucose 4,6-dehydratase